MKIPQMIAAELRRLTSHTMAIVALVALMCVPLLYGGLYLWANQNPYAKLNQIPAALVVSDRGTEVNGTVTNYGERVADQLVRDASFDWHRVSASTAARGVDDSRYDFSITIPEHFSDALASAAGTSPRQARVTLTTNDANSYLSSTIGQQAAAKLRSSIVTEVNKQAAARLLGGLATVRGNLVTAAGAAEQLSSGAGSAQSGAATLASGTAELASGASTLASGSSTLASGAGQVASGAQQVAAGNAKLAATADRAAAAANQAAAQLPAVRARIVAQLQAANVPADQIAQITAGLDQIGGAATTGNAQVQQLAAQVNALSAGANSVAAGASQTASGASSLAAGAASLQSGSQSAAAGASSLHDGLTTLHSGAQSLQSGLNSGVSRIPDASPALQKEQANTIANPIELKNASVTSAGTYGAGLAPFFVALAAWIGIYALFLIVKPVSRRAITALRTPVRVTLAGWLTPGLLGVVQMIALYFVVSGWLGFRIENPLGTYGIMALASLTYTAIVLALNVWLGSVGQFLGLVLMVLQLVTAGGTFPWQTLPAPLAALHHVLPMGFVVDALRQSMYGGSASAAASDLGVLVVWLVIALAIAGIGVVRMTHYRTLRDLRPSLIG